MKFKQLFESSEKVFDEEACRQLYVKYVSALLDRDFDGYAEKVSVAFPPYDDIVSGKSQVEVDVAVNDAAIVGMDFSKAGGILSSICYSSSGIDVDDDDLVLGREKTQDPFKKLIPKINFHGATRGLIFLKPGHEEDLYDTIETQMDRFEYPSDTPATIHQSVPLDLQAKFLKNSRDLSFDAINEQANYGGLLVARNKKTVNLDGLRYPSQYTFDLSTEELIVRHILNNDIEKSPTFKGSIECDTLVYSRFSSDRPHQDEWLLSLSKILKVKSGIHCTLMVRPSVREDFIKSFSQILKALFTILDKSGLPANHIQFIFSGNSVSKLFPSSSQFSNKVWDFLQDCLDSGVTIHEIEELIEEFLDENIK